MNMIFLPDLNLKLLEDHTCTVVAKLLDSQADWEIVDMDLVDIPCSKEHSRIMVFACILPSLERQVFKPYTGDMKQHPRNSSFVLHNAKEFKWEEASFTLVPCSERASASAKIQSGPSDCYPASFCRACSLSGPFSSFCHFWRLTLSPHSRGTETCLKSSKLKVLLPLISELNLLLIFLMSQDHFCLILESLRSGIIFSICSASLFLSSKDAHFNAF